MPTTITTPAHRLAALIAVEREASRAHVEARVKMHGAAGYADYQRAAQVDADAFIALLAAQIAVDDALGSLSYPGDGVMPLA